MLSTELVRERKVVSSISTIAKGAWRRWTKISSHFILSVYVARAIGPEKRDICEISRIDRASPSPGDVVMQMLLVSRRRRVYTLENCGDCETMKPENFRVEIFHPPLTLNTHMGRRGEKEVDRKLHMSWREEEKLKTIFLAEKVLPRLGHSIHSLNSLYTLCENLSFSDSKLFHSPSYICCYDHHPRRTELKKRREFVI